MSDGKPREKYEALAKVKLTGDEDPKIKEVKANSIRDEKRKIFGE